MTWLTWLDWQLDPNLIGIFDRDMLRNRGPTSDSDPGILAFSLIFGRLVAPLIILLSTVSNAEKCINCSALLSIAFSVINAEMICVKAEKITRFSNCKIAF